MTGDGSLIQGPLGVDAADILNPDPGDFILGADEAGGGYIKLGTIGGSSATPGGVDGDVIYFRLTFAQIFAGLYLKSGRVTLVAGTASVVFGTNMLDDTYVVTLVGGDETLRPSAITAAGFTVTSGDGASTSTVHWTAEPANNP